MDSPHETLGLESLLPEQFTSPFQDWENLFHDVLLCVNQCPLSNEETEYLLYYLFTAYTNNANLRIDEINRLQYQASPFQFELGSSYLRTRPDQAKYRLAIVQLAFQFLDTQYPQMHFAYPEKDQPLWHVMIDHPNVLDIFKNYFHVIKESEWRLLAQKSKSSVLILLDETPPSADEIKRKYQALIEPLLSSGQQRSSVTFAVAYKTERPIEGQHKLSTLTIYCENKEFRKRFKIYRSLGYAPEYVSLYRTVIKAYRQTRGPLYINSFVIEMLITQQKIFDQVLVNLSKDAEGRTDIVGAQDFVNGLIEDVNAQNYRAKAKFKLDLSDLAERKRHIGDSAIDLHSFKLILPKEIQILFDAIEKLITFTRLTPRNASHCDSFIIYRYEKVFQQLGLYVVQRFINQPHLISLLLLTGVGYMAKRHAIQNIQKFHEILLLFLATIPTADPQRDKFEAIARGHAILNVCAEDDNEVHQKGTEKDEHLLWRFQHFQGAKWYGKRGGQLNTAKVSLLRRAYVANYAMRGFANLIAAYVYMAVARQERPVIVTYNQSYFELLSNMMYVDATVFRARSVFDRLPDGSKLILIDMHPNNSVEPELWKHRISQLLIDILFGIRDSFEYKGKRETITIIIDATTNTLTDHHIWHIVRELNKFIDWGFVNIAILRSLTKFPQLSADKLSAAFVLLYNNGLENWQAFNAKLDELLATEMIDPLIERYFVHLFEHTERIEEKYIQQIRYI